MSEGYLKLYRSTLDNPIVMKDADHLAIWIWLLMNARYKPTDVMFGGKRITLKPGQMTTGRRVISQTLGVSESKVQRVLSAFESEHQIEQLTDHRCRLISIVRWSEYQSDEQLTEQELNKFRTSSEQVVNTKRKKEKERERKEKEGESLYYGLSTEVQEAMSAYEEMRKKRKWAFGDRAKKMFLKKLFELSDGNQDLMVKIIDEATLRNWRSCYLTDDMKQTVGKGLPYSDIDF